MNPLAAVWLIVLAIVLVVALIGLLLYLLWRRGGGALPGTVSRPSTGLWRRGLKAAFSDEVGPGRYAVPCVFVTGDAGAGKSALLDGADLLTVCVPPEQPQPSGWWRNGDGVAFELPGLANEDSGIGRALWRAALSLLERQRGRRPLDAMVWVLPLAAMAGDKADIEARAARLRQQLTDLQNKLGQQLPLYVVISKCDQLDGFGAFAGQLPVALTKQMLGWSNPYALGVAFQPGWIREGLADVTRQLHGVIAELAVQQSAGLQYDRLYLMPDALAAALVCLPDLLAQALRPHVGLPSWDLRGIYLTGRGESAPPSPIDPFEPMPQTVEAPTMFCRDLFQRRVFGEFGLAQPVQGRISGTRTMRLRLTAGVGAMALFWVVCMVIDYRHALLQAESMTAPLTALRNELDHADGNGAAQRARIPALLSAMDGVPNWTFDDYPLAWSIPLSLNSGYTRRIRGALQRYYEGVVFKNMDTALAAKAKDLTRAGNCGDFGLERAASGGTATLTPAIEFAKLSSYVDQTILYESQNLRFDRLAAAQEGNWTEAAALMRYLFGITAARRTPASEQAFDQIISVSSYRRSYQPAAADFSCRLKQLHRAWLEQQFGQQTLTTVLAELDDHLDKFSHGELDDHERLDQLRRAIGQLRALLARSNLAAGADGALARDNTYQTLLKKIGDSSLLGGPSQAAALEADASEAQQKLADKLDAGSGGDNAVLVQTQGKSTTLPPAIDELDGALDLLLRHRFSQDTTGGVPPASQRMDWDLTGLDAPPTLLQEYQAYETTELSKAPARFRAALQHAARAQASAAISGAIALATVPADHNIGSRSDNFDQAQKQLTPMLLALRKLDHPQLAAQWEHVLRNQAQLLLAALDSRVAGAGLYAADTAVIANWDGQPQAALLAFNAGSVDELQDYLAAQATQASELANAGRPLRMWLEQDRTGTGKSTLAQMDIELARYAAKNPAGSLRQLEHLIALDLNGIDNSNCGERLAKLTRSREGDYFQQRGQTLVRQFTQRCTVLQRQTALKAYSDIATYYNLHLAERYPFAAGADAPPADPEEVRELLRLLDQHYTDTHDGLARLHDNALQPARAFLDMLGAVRPMLSAVLGIDAAGGTPATLDLWPEFRINRSHELGGDQIIEWRIDTGGAAQAGPAATAPGPAPTLPLSWRLGDPLALTLRWAKDSALAPTPDPLHDPAMLANGKSARWNYGGAWALLHLLSEHPAPAAEMSGRDSARPHALRFEVPTRHADGHPGARAVVYARLGLSLHGKNERLALVSFPATLAPPLPSPGAAPGQLTASTP